MEGNKVNGFQRKILASKSIKNKTPSSLLGDNISMPSCSRCGNEISDSANFCSNCGTQIGMAEETFSVSSDELVQRARELIHEGNVRRIIIKSEEGKTLLEMPVTIGVIGVVLVPWLAAIGAVAALATRCTIVVLRQESS